MSHLLDRLQFFNRVTDEFSDGHGVVTNEDRGWEEGYRKRWQHDKIVSATIFQTAWVQFPASGGLGGFLLPIMFGAILDRVGVNSSCFMLLYGIVWVSLTLNHLTEVRRAPVMGELKPAAAGLQS